MAAGRFPIAQTIATPRSIARPSTRGVALWGVICLLALNAASLLLLIQVANLTTETYAWERLEAERQRWLASNYELEAQAAELQSLNRIERDARDKLKMVPATEVIYVKVPVAPRSGIQAPGSGGDAGAGAPPVPRGGLSPLQALTKLLGVGN